VKSSLRPSTPEDASAIKALWQEAGLWLNSDPLELHWKYWQPRADWPGPRSFVMARGEKILAHAGLIPGVCAVGSRRLSTIHMIDWAALGTAAGAGVSLMKHVGRSADVLLAIGGSAQTLKILPHLGYRAAAPVTTFVRTLHPLRILAPSAHSAWKLPARFARSVYWKLRAPSPTLEDWQVTLVPASETRSLLSVLPAATENTAVLERNEALLRHALACPIAPMQLYSVAQGGRIRGYFLLSFVMGQVRLADCWIDSQDSFDWSALVYCAVRAAKRERRAAELVAWASDPLLTKCLLQCGFHARVTQPVQFLAPASVNFSVANLRLQMLDNDAAYRHLGRKAFLA
jgi:hypothetical protein